jgi:two-component system, chemotaxis family, CheB/CheR fusion protein
MNENRIDQDVPAVEPVEGRGSAIGQRPSYVVGIGASAGGLEALEQLFKNMPVDSGMAFVVVQHLSPDFKGLMVELLARKTQLPIYRVEEGKEGMQVQPNTIYLIRPRKDMIIANGRLLLTDTDPKQLVALPIDHFFRSLAQDCRDRAIGIILSGSGSDGSRGIVDIHEAGGLVIVQTPETTNFDSMPNSAKQTGVASLVLPPEQMPAALRQYSQHALASQVEWDSKTGVVPDIGLAAIFRLLQDNYGIDFSHYKLNTVNRRIDRRVLLTQSADLDDYVQRLREDGGELNNLYKDLLIGVTSFFRDTEAFERLGRQALPQLLGEVGDNEEFRVWVPGCATGEEAYSLAILVQECLESLQRQINVKIFATDVHRASLDFASAAVYSRIKLVAISPERLGRHFVCKGDGYQVANELRKMVVFAPHNILKDAPFTKLALITCRNLLIYLQPQAQNRILSLFHFSLKTGGVLFLGPSETPGALTDEFTAIDAHWNIYRKRRDIRLPADLRLPLPAGDMSRLTATLAPARLSGAAVPEHQMIGTYDALLEQVMPPSLLVNEHRELVESFADASRYIRLKKGRLSTDILDLVDADVKTVLSGALSRVSVEKKPVAYKGIRLKLPEGERFIDLTVKPVLNQRSNTFYALIIIEEQGSAPPPLAAPADVDLAQASRDQVHSLEVELLHTKENLQATIEELQTSNEELQATNEELVASNEELQSTNEELHSVNEELYTVNAEYQKKITEMTELTADMDNLLVSTQIHTLFLDRNLRIRKFTPGIAQTFNLLEQDVGRPLDNFSHNIDTPTLTEDLRKVMETGGPFEQQVRDRRGNWFLLRILPYHTKQGVGGGVLTLIDLAHVKRAEAEARTKDQQLSSILKNSPHLVYIKDAEGRFLATDATFKNVIGCNPVGKKNVDVFPPETADMLDRLDQQVLTQGTTVETELVLTHAGVRRTYLAVKFPVSDDMGQIIGLGVISTDVTGLKHAEQQAREAAENRDRFLAMLSHELRNPLGAISSAATVLERESASETERRKATQVIQRQAGQMGCLLDDLLEVSRITQNKILLHNELVRLDPLLDEAEQVIRPALEKGQLTLDVQKDDGPLFIAGDPTRLQQMVVNLLMNAVKYTPAGGHVWMELCQQEGEAVLRIRDTGVGIRPDMLEKVFDLFIQADDTLVRSRGGIGVGLTLVRRIAELHGGSVQAKSDGAGQGSEFTVRLPLTTKAEELVQSPASSSLSGLPATIVIVEDNDDSRRMLESLLKLEGYNVVAARDGQEGLEAILAHQPRVALVDIGLPGLNGYELARQVRSRLGKKDVFLVALTGYGQPADRKAVLEAGFDEHLVKPLKRGELERLLQRTQTQD